MLDYKSSETISNIVTNWRIQNPSLEKHFEDQLPDSMKNTITFNTLFTVQVQYSYIEIKIAIFYISKNYKYIRYLCFDEF